MKWKISTFFIVFLFLSISPAFCIDLEKILTDILQKIDKIQKQIDELKKQEQILHKKLIELENKIDFILKYSSNKQIITQRKLTGQITWQGIIQTDSVKPTLYDIYMLLQKIKYNKRRTSNAKTGNH